MAIGVTLFAIGAAIVSGGLAPPPLLPRERRLIDAWLFCIDCRQSQLDSVLVLASRKPEATVDTLSRDLLAGLRASRRANFEAQWHDASTKLKAEAQGDGRTPRLSEAAYVELALANANSLCRRRAAIALARIGGQRALTALNAAVDSVTSGSPAFQDPVALRITLARDSIWHP